VLEHGTAALTPRQSAPPPRLTFCLKQGFSARAMGGVGGGGARGGPGVNACEGPIDRLGFRAIAVVSRQLRVVVANASTQARSRSPWHRATGTDWPERGAMDHTRVPRNGSLANKGDPGR